MVSRSVRVLTDSCCDLPPELTAARGISVLPMSVNLGGELLRDGADLSPEEFYRRVSSTGTIPTTAQITPVEYARFFHDATAGGAEAIYVGLSSGLSGSLGNAAAVAAEPELEGRAVVVDSLGASVGQGLMVLRAADLADSGLSAKEIKAELEDFRARVCHLFTLDTLDFAARSGRITRFSAIAADMLGIKPVLKVDMTGRLVPFDKVRGRKRAIGRMFDELQQLGADVRGKRVGVNHAADPDMAAAMAERLRTEHGAGEVVIGQIGSTVGAHVGPGCVSIFFEGPVGRGE